MSETAAIIPANPSNPTPSLLLEDVFFAPLFQALQAPGITRGCATVDDASFAALAVLRVLENSKTGRDFIQIHGIPNIPGLTRSNYFDGLASPRRLQMFLAMERELQRQQLPTLRAHDDRLAHFGELDEMEIWAGDGHHIAHATHDARNEKGTYSPVNAIYKLDLRSGWMRFMDLVRPTARGLEHEITTLKRQDKQELRCGAAKGCSEAKLKSEEGIQDTKVIKAWQKDLAKRTEKARAAGRHLPVKLYQALYRPTEVSLQFIRWLRVGLMRPTCYRQAIEQLRPLMLA